METTNQFTTRSDQRWYIGMSTIIFILIGIIGGAGMWIWSGMPGPGWMVLFLALFSGGFMALMLKNQPNAQLHFVGDELRINHVDGKKYEVYAVPASDFICRQTPLERKYNVGRIQVKGTIFCFYGVQNYDETCRYILDNFPNY